MDIPGIEDIKEIDIEGIEGVDVYTTFSDFSTVRNKVEEMGYVIDDAEIIKEAKVTKTLSEKDLEKAVSALERIEENDDVQSVWSDLVY